jgi:hypothetical protein
MRDTSAAASAQYFELLRKAGPAQRLRTAVALTSAVRALAEAGLRERYANASDEEIRVRLAVRLYGREVVAKLFAAIPDDAV